MAGSESAGSKAEMEADMNVERLEKPPKTVTGLGEKKIRQESDSRDSGDIKLHDVTGKEVENDEDTILSKKHKEVMEQSEVLFNSQEEEIPTVAGTEEYDVNAGKEQQSSENERTDVNNRSSTTDDQASEPTEKMGDKKGEGKGDSALT